MTLKIITSDQIIHEIMKIGIEGFKKEYS